jgi:YidC/Oxa1 family membrane protein insertase
MSMIRKVPIPRWRQLLSNAGGSLVKQRPSLAQIQCCSTSTSTALLSDWNVSSTYTELPHVGFLRQQYRIVAPLSLLSLKNYNDGMLPPSTVTFNHSRRTFFSFGRNPDKPPPTTSTDLTSSEVNETMIKDDDDFNDGRTTSVVDSDDNGSSTVDETLNKLFAEQSSSTTSTTSSLSDAWYTTAENLSDAATVWDPTWYNVADNAIIAINTVQQVTGLPYGLSIIVTTAILRITLFPLMVHAQRAASRMAHVQPELQALKDRYERISSPTRNDQMQFSTNMQALFKRYKVNPFQTIVAPVVQIPLFIGMFFGLKKVSTYFPDELKAGGMLWFTDLSVPDPLYILPVMSSATFLLLVELGKEQMLRAGGSSVAMLNAFRFMCIVSLPLVVNFEASMLLYWVANNLLTCCQTLALQTPALRKQFGILESPKPLPGSDPNKDSIVASVTDLVNRAQGKAVTDAQKIQKHNQEVEAKKVSSRLTRAARERERRRVGITGTRNY